ncbi:MAG: hypothetical protein GY769_23770 [bacterium]|nr:hypothetical protein [bacterium]
MWLEALSRRQTALRLVLLVGLLAVGLLVLVAVRQLVRFELAMDATGDPMSIGDPEIGYVSAPSATTHRSHQATGVRYTVFTDTRSARVDGAGLESPPSVSLMTLGGSFAWGHGVENEQTFTSVLGASMGVDVANFAKAGYSTLQSLQILRRNADLRPSVVIYGFTFADLRRNLAPCAPSHFPFCMKVPFLDLETGVPIVHVPGTETAGLEAKREKYLEAFNSGSPLKRAAIAPKFFLGRWKKAWIERRVAARRSEGDSAAALSYLIGELDREARLIGATLLVVHIPVLEKPVASPPEALLGALRDNGGVVFEDIAQSVRPLLETLPEGSLVLHESDGHPNAVAHGLIADQIREAIVVRDLLTRR